MEGNALTKSRSKIFVHQIYYDQQSQKALDPGFIPLDNTSNKRPDWYELWPIRNYLSHHDLDDEAWYGFLSPRFFEKTGVKSSLITDMLSRYGQTADVALFSPGWDQLAYFLNPFEQGEIWHPGLLNLSQTFFDEIELGVNLSELVTCSKTSVFSNYIIAKPSFWREWLDLADKFFAFVEGGSDFRYGNTTNYGTSLNQTVMKTFIQERFASVILTRGNFRVLSLDRSDRAPIFTRIFSDTPLTRRMLQTCDLLKERFCLSGDPDFLKVYRKIRNDIPFKRPHSLS